MSSKARDIFNNGSKKSTKKKYGRIQSAYVKWLEDEKLNPMEQNMLINYITYIKDKVLPGSLWSIYSIINK
eukprot:2264771-Ditylum_brightwellii.AAC.1